LSALKRLARWMVAKLAGIHSGSSSTSSMQSMISRMPRLYEKKT
jgi:hypothetical protein